VLGDGEEGGESFGGKYSVGDVDERDSVGDVGFCEVFGIL